MAEHYRRRRNYDSRLTDEELWLLMLLRNGKKLVEISRLLEKPEWWAKYRAHRIYDKLGADNKVQAVMIAIDCGILQRERPEG